MLIFSTLVFFAFRARFNPSAHNRLILIATIALMDAPTGRPPFVVITGRPHLDSIFCWLFLLLLAGYDLFLAAQVPLKDSYTYQVDQLCGGNWDSHTPEPKPASPAKDLAPH